MAQLGWQLSGTPLVCSSWNLICKIQSELVLYRSRYLTSRCPVPSITHWRRIIQNDRLWIASSLCYVSSIHPISTYISFLFRLGIKPLQIMLTPISMSYTLITSQHHKLINLGLLNLTFHWVFCRKDMLPILPGNMQPFFCYEYLSGFRCWSGRFLGYHHPSGEVHITDNNQWVSCPGKKIYLTKKNWGLLTIIYL